MESSAMRREDFFEALDHRIKGIEADASIEKARESERIAMLTKEFLSGGGEVEYCESGAQAYEYQGFSYRLNLGGSTPLKK